MKKSHEILGIKYVKCYYYPVTAKMNTKTVYTIDEKGIRKQEYSDSRKADSSIFFPHEGDKYQKLCQDIDDCIEDADSMDSYEDDISVSVTILRAFGRVENMDRGLGSVERTIGSILDEYTDVFCK